jgi:hypothetical protein
MDEERCGLDEGWRATTIESGEEADPEAEGVDSEVPADAAVADELSPRASPT